MVSDKSETRFGYPECLCHPTSISCSSGLSSELDPSCMKGRSDSQQLNALSSEDRLPASVLLTRKNKALISEDVAAAITHLTEAIKSITEMV